MGRFRRCRGEADGTVWRGEHTQLLGSVTVLGSGYLPLQGPPGPQLSLKSREQKKCIHEEQQLKRSLRDHVGGKSVLNPWVCCW